MSDAWREHYDSWKLAPGVMEYGDDDDPDATWEAQAEEAAEDRAERAREDAMFDRDDREEW